MTAAGRTRSATSEGRGKLTRDQLVDAALELVDTEGLEALTLRKLAVSLGVTPMAMYWHVADKDALLSALGERMFAGVELPERADDWFEDISAVARAIVEQLRRHPAAAPLAVSTVLTSPPGLRLAERVLTRLSDAGFSDREASEVGGYLLSAITMLVTAMTVASQPAEDQMAAKLTALRGLPAETYPTVTRMAAELARCDDPDGYLDTGLDLLMLGIKSLAAR